MEFRSLSMLKVLATKSSCCELVYASVLLARWHTELKSTTSCFRITCDFEFKSIMWFSVDDCCKDLVEKLILIPSIHRWLHSDLLFQTRSRCSINKMISYGFTGSFGRPWSQALNSSSASFECKNFNTNLLRNLWKVSSSFARTFPVSSIQFVLILQRFRLERCPTTFFLFLLQPNRKFHQNHFYPNFYWLFFVPRLKSRKCLMGLD